MKGPLITILTLLTLGTTPVEASLHIPKADTMQQRSGINTSRSNIKRPVAHPPADIGVNEPGVNLAPVAVRFKAGAELADKVNKRSANRGNNSFDVILKNGGSSLAMLEQKGFTYLSDNSLLIAPTLPVKFILPSKREGQSPGTWKLVSANQGINRQGSSAGTPLKLKDFGKNIVMAEAEGLQPGRYTLVWTPANTRANTNLKEAEWEFCYQYLPSGPASLEQMEIDETLGICDAPGAISSNGPVNFEVLPPSSLLATPGHNSTRSNKVR